MKKKLKEDYYVNMNDKLNDYKRTDSKNYWKLIRSLIKDENILPEFPPLLNNGETAFTGENKANIF